MRSLALNGAGARAARGRRVHAKSGAPAASFPHGLPSKAGVGRSFCDVVDPPSSHIVQREANPEAWWRCTPDATVVLIEIASQIVRADEVSEAAKQDVRAEFRTELLGGGRWVDASAGRANFAPWSRPGKTWACEESASCASEQPARAVTGGDISSVCPRTSSVQICTSMAAPHVASAHRAVVCAPCACPRGPRLRVRPEVRTIEQLCTVLGTNWALRPQTPLGPSGGRAGPSAK